MIKNINNKKVVVCDECGDVISWKIDKNLIHGYTCTKCIDLDFGKYRILDISKDELEYAGYDPDKLSGDIMSGLAEELKLYIMINVYWQFIDEYLKKLGISRSR